VAVTFSEIISFQRSYISEMHHHYWTPNNKLRLSHCSCVYFSFVGFLLFLLYIQYEFKVILNLSLHACVVYT